MNKKDRLQERDFGQDVPSSYHQPVTSSGNPLQFMRLHPLICYFLLAYGLSWLGWLPEVLSQSGLGLLPLHLSTWSTLPGGFLGPCLSGFLMTAITSGKAGLRQLLRRFIVWRVGIQWYGFALFGFPMLSVLGILAIVPGASAAFRFSALLPTLLAYAGFFLIGIFISPLAEEPGWRGFALPRLQARYGSLRGTLLLGLLWGGWHFPLFLTAGYDGAGSGLLGVIIPFAEFLIMTIGTAIIMTWVFNYTRTSLLLAMLIHGSVDSFPVLFLFPHKNISASSLVIVLLPGICSLALLVLIATRGKLGYQESSAIQQDEALPKSSPPSQTPDF